MPRKTPARIRIVAARSHRSVDGMGALPAPIWHALVRLERADLDPLDVAYAMINWRRIDKSLAHGHVARQSNDVEYLAPHYRELLEVAISALSGRARRQLAHLVHDLDDRIQSGTLEDQRLPAGPWWCRIMVID